ncbi:glycosyltransferase family 39 protein [Archangium lipolyticum]|uniref:glycosyltransferase family 39 protein n=1 Tax=Archangium lipolyticum TaxID=2970465 RepID=UPI00214A3392|nr:mannosyltransferase [Archangium lipolyticum]
MTAPAPVTAPPPPLVPTPDAPPSAVRRRWPLMLLLGTVGLLPAVIAVAQLGRIHPDEVYQLLEPAWHRAHGYGVLAWEWRVGLRNWAAPGLAAWLLRLADALGLTHPVAYRALLAVPQVALHGWMSWAVYRFAERRAGHAGGLFSLLVVGLYGPVLVFAGRTLGESLSTAFLVVAMEALDRDERPVRAGLVGGLALGLSVVARYGSAVMVLAALVWLVAARRWRVLAFTCLSGLGVALGLGALDWATWGKPFHSFFAYVDFNVLSGQAARQFGASPPGFYLHPFVTGLPVWMWAVAPLGLLALRQRLAVSLPLFCAGVYLVAITATAHKEERFLYPGLVLVAVAAAPSLAAFILGQTDARSRWGLGTVALLATLVPAHFYPPMDLRGDQFRAIVSATRDDNARGLLIVNEGLWGSGGYFYIGKNIPWGTCDHPSDANFQAAMQDRRINRAVTFEGRAVPELQAAGFRVVEQVGRETVLARD